MCLRRKTPVSSDAKKTLEIRRMDPPLMRSVSPSANMPSGGTQEFLKTKQKDKERETETDDKTSSSPRQIPPKEKPSEPLHIKVPPPRVMKAKRPMIEVRSARDPEYKTIQMDPSEWESVKIYKRNEINLEELLKQENNVLQKTQ